MCGIVGFVNSDGRAADREVLGAMNAAIVHRGPDDDGFYLHENVGLAMRRLAMGRPLALPWPPVVRSSVASWNTTSTPSRESLTSHSNMRQP